jgi:tetratricopeptide (TPR) repeat protein
VKPEAPKPEPKAAEPRPEPKKSAFADAEQQFKSGNVEGALQKYLEAAKSDPDNAAAQRQIGKCYNRLGQRERAQPYFKRYLELKPDASDAAFIRAMIQ